MVRVGWLIDGGLPMVSLFLAVRTHHIPQLHQAQSLFVKSFMFALVCGIGTKTGAWKLSFRKHAVNTVEHHLRAAIGHREINHIEFVVDGFQRRHEIPARRFKRTDVSALKTENGLLDVTHRKHRARVLALLLGEEGTCQGFYNGPLGRAGVLCFIDKDVRQALVELIQHPLRSLVPFKQLCGLGDQVIKVIEPLRALGDVDPHQHTSHGAIESEICTERFLQCAAFEKVEDSLSFQFQPVCCDRIIFDCV